MLQKPYYHLGRRKIDFELPDQHSPVTTATDGLREFILGLDGSDITVVVRGLVTLNDIHIIDHLPFLSLEFIACDLKGLVFDDSNLKSLLFRSCKMTSISARGVSLSKDLHLNECEISGELSIEYANIERQVFIIDCTVGDGAEWSVSGRALCTAELRIDGSHFRGGIDLIDGVVKGALNANATTVSATSGDIGIRLNRARLGSAFFRRDSFSRKDNTINTVIDGSVELTRATIDHDLDFDGTSISCRVNGYAIIAHRCYIGGSVYLENDFKAKGTVSFQGGKLTGRLRLFNANIVASSEVESILDARIDVYDHKYCCIDLSECYVANLILKSESNAPHQGIMNLAGCEVDNLIDSREFWGLSLQKCALSRIALISDGFEYKNIERPSGHEDEAEPDDLYDFRRSWLMLQVSDHVKHHFRGRPWDWLSGVLEAQGYLTISRKVLVEKHRLAAKSTSLSFRGKILSRFLMAIGDHGFNPFKTLALSIALVVLFALIYSFVIMLCGGINLACSADVAFIRALPADLNDGTVPIERLSAYYAGSYPAFNSTIYSLDVFIPFLDLGMERFWIPNSHLQFRLFDQWFGVGVALYIITVFEQVCGALIVSLSAISLTGLLDKKTR